LRLCSLTSTLRNSRDDDHARVQANQRPSVGDARPDRAGGRAGPGPGHLVVRGHPGSGTGQDESGHGPSFCRWRPDESGPETAGSHQQGPAIFAIFTGGPGLEHPGTSLRSQGRADRLQAVQPGQGGRARDVQLDPGAQPRQRGIAGLRGLFPESDRGQGL